jgi:hypothetical protein
MMQRPVQRTFKFFACVSLGLLLAWIGVGATEVYADTLRDPTQPPAAIASPAAVVRQPLDDLRAEHIVIVNGVRYLVWNSRRYAVGEEIAGAKIERILENAVWLKTNGTVRKLMLFPNIEKKPVSNDKPAAPPEKTTPLSTPTKPDGKNGLKK